jgi:hypothetical protein
MKTIVLSCLFFPTDRTNPSYLFLLFFTLIKTTFPNVISVVLVFTPFSRVLKKSFLSVAFHSLVARPAVFSQWYQPHRHYTKEIVDI